MNKNALNPAYEPTERETRAIAAFDKRSAGRKPLPSITSTLENGKGGQKNAYLKVDHSNEDIGYKLIAESLASEHWAFTAAMIDGASRVARTPTGISEDGINQTLAFVAGSKPQDQLEAALALQMAAVHAATMKAVERLAASTKFERIEQHEKSLTRLARTFAAQVEALKRYRSKGEQRVYVERVNVSDGGQAVIGNLSHGGRGGGLLQNDR